MLTGAILAGGRSQRFGRNKALEVFRGKRFIDHGLESLQAACDPLLVVANDLACYYDVRATLVRDVLPWQGPLGGIYTALLFSPHDWLFVKATDMPFLVPELLDLMLQLRPGVDAVVPQYRNRYVEPLLALYHRRCLPVIGGLLESTERKTSAFYRDVNVRLVAEEEWRVVDPQGLSFCNVNTMKDREQLQ